jgi:two-component system response regulator AtoC
MAATNRNLKDAVAKGEFREDLYFRLNVVTLTVPSLRERREDIVPLAEQFAVHSALALKKSVPQLTDSTKTILSQYEFPGNIRELRNLIERAVLFCHGNTLEAAHFPSDIQGDSRPLTAQFPPTLPSLSQPPDPMQIHISFRIGEQSLADLEDHIIAEVLQRAGGNKTLAAKHLGITRWMLDRRRKLT